MPSSSSRIRQVKFLLRQVLARTFRSARPPRSGWLRGPSVVMTGFLQIAPLTLGVAFFSGILMLFGGIEQENSQALAGYYKSLNFSGVITQPGADTEVYNAAVSPVVLKDADRYFRGQVAPVQVYFGRYGPQDVVYMGIKPGSLAAPSIYQGRMFSDEQEVVFDRYLAADLSLKLGQRVKLAGQMVTVVGLSEHTDASSRRRVFVAPAMYARLSGTDTVNFILVRGEAYKPPAGFQVYTRQAWLDGAIGYGKRNISPLVDASAAFVTAGAVVACAALGFFVQLRNRRQMALVRTQGMSRGQLVCIELAAMIVQVAIGFAAGIGFGWLGIWYAASTSPGFHGSVNAGVVAYAAVLIWPATLLAGLLPIWLVTRKLSLIEVLRAG